MKDHEKIMALRAALQVILDQVDYTAGACRPVEMVGACLPTNIIDKTKKTLQETKP